MNKKKLPETIEWFAKIAGIFTGNVIKELNNLGYLTIGEQRLINLLIKYNELGFLIKNVITEQKKSLKTDLYN